MDQNKLSVELQIILVFLVFLNFLGYQYTCGTKLVFSEAVGDRVFRIFQSFEFQIVVTFQLRMLPLLDSEERIGPSLG